MTPGGLSVVPESVLPPKFGTQEFGYLLGLHQWLSFTQNTKWCLDLSCRFYHMKSLYQIMDLSIPPCLKQTEICGQA